MFTNSFRSKNNPGIGNPWLNRVSYTALMVFSPASLFAASEPGVWYDPSDLTTLFQDSAGTTPVTATGQTVGLMLDKSKGLVLGPELVTNGDFSSGASWAVLGGASISGGQLVFADGIFSEAYQDVAITVGKLYVYEFDLTITSGSIVFRPNRTSTVDQQTYTTSGRKRISAFATGTRIGPQGSAVGVRIDNISVKELAGNHATQATTASRPIYGVVPLGGRRNLLTFTEDVSNAAWQFLSTTVTGNASAAPNGDITADRIQLLSSGTSSSAQQSLTMTVANQTFTVSCYVKSNTMLNQTFRLKCTHGGVSDYFSDLLTATTEWQRFSFTQAFGAGGTNIIAGLTAGTAATDLLVWGAQLELGSTATAYQKVTTQYDVTQAGVQSLSYLSFDGVDDFMVTNTITPAIDKVQVFAGVRQLLNSNQILLETSTITDSFNGTFAIIPSGGGSRMRSKGTAIADITRTGLIIPKTYIFTGLGDISAPLSSISFNGGSASTVTTSQGTGNYLTYPIYIGRRGDTTLPFNGQIYSLIVRFGANLNATTISNTETYVNGKTGAF